MTYFDDSAPPITHYQIPYDPWDEPSISPTSPPDDTVRRAIRNAMDLHPNWSPSQIKANLWHGERLQVSIAVIYGVKAGM